MPDRVLRLDDEPLLGPVLYLDIGALEHARRSAASALGRIIRVRIMPDSEHGPGVDLREWVTEERWARTRAARAKAALTGRQIKGPLRPEQYVGPLRKGWRLGPGAAEELADLLALAVVKAEAIAEEAESR
jgi:hypothetical protein